MRVDAVVGEEALEQLGVRFEKKTGKKVSFTFGSTGLLTKQIEEACDRVHRPVPPSCGDVTGPWDFRTESQATP